MKWIFILSALSLGACASAKPQPTAPTPQAPAASTTPAATPSAKSPTSVANPKAAASSSSSKSESTESQKVSCEKDKDMRLLEIEKQDKGCALNYTKAGKAASVASSSHGLKHCIDTQKKVRSKLEAAGFKCN